MTAVRAVVSGRANWRQTARLVATELTRNLPSSDILSPEQRIGDPEATAATYSTGTRAFWIVALVWRPA